MIVAARRRHAMAMNASDTIVAISSAVGSAARMIVRASGPASRSLLAHLTPNAAFIGGGAERTRLHVAGMTIPAWVYCFATPHSVTGEDVLEMHIPGNPLLARLLLEEAVKRGARQAEPGEFTARAYFNGRMDLTAAEGVAATIAAHSDRELAAARQLLAGELSRRLAPLMDRIAETLGVIEVGIDFSEEEVQFISSEALSARLGEIDAGLQRLLDESTRFERLSHEPQVVLIGRPNAGKSTLLNALAGEQRAVVSPHAGTTRDAIAAEVRLRRGTIRLLDVAGLDHADKTDSIARQMQSRARQTLEAADLVLLVRDGQQTSDDLPISDRPPDLIVETKSDLGERSGTGVTEPVAHAKTSTVHVSALTGENLDALRDRLDEMAFGAFDGAASLALNARHVHAVEQARQAVTRACQRIGNAGDEILALELREALDLLGGVLGDVSPDDVLGRIFSTFCIGK
jgi:tRNA modification GTPase